MKNAILFQIQFISHACQLHAFTFKNKSRKVPKSFTLLNGEKIFFENQLQSTNDTSTVQVKQMLQNVYNHRIYMKKSK